MSPIRGMGAMPGLTARLFEAILHRVVKTGDLTYIDPWGMSHRYGDGNPPRATMRLTDPADVRRLVLNANLHFGEAYTDGRIRLDDCDLADLMAILAANTQRYGAEPWIWRLGERIKRSVRALSGGIGRREAEANVSHHYDLPRDLYDRMLDSRRQYSCAYFESSDDDLESAQLNKLSRIAAKLCLRPGQRVLDIGCGWGGLGAFIAQVEDVEVLGITLSKEQLAVARENAERLGLSDRLRFELMDYREVTGSFDRIVSVGMFEHVGVPDYRDFFAAVRDRLTPDGIALLHSIGRYDGPGTTNAWIDKYIFPGGYIPALSEVIPVIERSDLWAADIEILRVHYAETLARWRKNFHAARDAVRERMEERFFRLWDFYLVASEMSFRFQNMMVFQVQLTRQRDAVPLTRTYMDESVRKLREAAVQAARKVGDGRGSQAAE